MARVHTTWWGALGLLSVGLGGVLACSDSGGSKLRGSECLEADAACPGADGGFAQAMFEVRPGVESVTVVGAKAGSKLTLYDAKGTRLLTIVTGAEGQAHFAYLPAEHLVLEGGTLATLPVENGRTLPAGDGYVIRNDGSDPVQASAPFRVLAVSDVPDVALYEGQVLKGVHTSLLGSGEDPEAGLNYIAMRDGVTLSAMVRFPDRSIYGDGPYPTVIEYSGYSPSKPSGAEPGSSIANLMGYATVGVNMRGTGCSGGVFDIFNPAQHADGYDVVEAVARQAWVLHHKVGMVGLSYSGISQLYVASTTPPSLAGITPLSTLADPWELQWPGGIYNEGFTRSWLSNRDASAMANGMEWSVARIAAGDKLCKGNQELRPLNVNFESFLHALKFYPNDAADRSLPLLIDRIDVPVYQTGAFQDEQTGPHFADMLDRYQSSVTRKIILYNGRHPDGYSPLVLTRWWEFLELFVARRVPRMNELVRAQAGPMLSQQFGAKGLSFEPDRFADLAKDDYQGALKRWQAEPPVRVLFENGAGGTEPGAPLGRFEASFAAWPPMEAKRRVFYLESGGTLTSAAAKSASAASFKHDPDAGARNFFGPKGYQILAPLWDVDWSQFAAGDVLSYLSEPFAADTVIAGPGHVELFVKSSAAEAQVQVSLSEVRPDGNEYLVQSGWLDLGHRKVDASRRDDLRVYHTYRSEDYAPMPIDTYERALIAIPSLAHAFRAGSQLRLTVSSPGRNSGLWQFEAPDYESPPVLTVSQAGERPSALVLPVVSGVDVAEGYPPCPALRGQPCRAYVPVANTSASL